MPQARGRPRTTKNVYFFKSGDQTFPGVRLPVNTRKYRHLDAVLDDLSFRIPGLPRGVRTLSTPQGRDKVTDLTQLRHMGSYVCSDLIQARHVPGVNLSKIKGLSDPQLIRSTSAFYEEAEPPPERVKKIKKKKKKVKKVKKKKKLVDETLLSDETQADERQKSSGAVSLLAEGSLMAMGQNRIVTTAKSVEDLEAAPVIDEDEAARLEKLSPRAASADDYPDGGVYGANWRQSQEDAVYRSEEREEEEEEGEEEYEDEEGEYEDEEQRSPRDKSRQQSKGSNRDRMSTRQSPRQTSVKRRSSEESDLEVERAPSEGQKDLAPLDGNKLMHVQRRRLASNQVDSDKYTLPSGSASAVFTNSRNSGGNRSGNAVRPTGTSGSERRQNGIEHQAKTDDVASLRVDELLSLSDEPATIAPRSETKNEHRIPTSGSQTRVNPAKEKSRKTESRLTDSGVSLPA